MILIYSFYIFMIIVKVSNSIKQNYAVIYYEYDYIETFLSMNGVCSYKSYGQSVRKFDFQLLDPQDYFLSIYNPYYYFVPSASTFRYMHHKNVTDDVLKQSYNGRNYRMKYSLTADSSELRLSGLNPLYWYTKRPKFYGLNINITSMCALYNLASTYCEDVKDYDPGAILKGILDEDPQQQNIPAALDLTDIVTFDKVIEKEPTDEFKVAPKFYSITENEYCAIKKLMSYLPITKDDFRSHKKGPENNEEIDDYLKRNDETVKYYFYLNKNLHGPIQSNSIKKMSIDRVKNLKLPYLLRFESYNFYVLRMKNMGIIPFHLESLKKKFGVFLDWKQVTIFAELGVDLKIDATLELTNGEPIADTPISVPNSLTPINDE